MRLAVARLGLSCCAVLLIVTVATPRTASATTPAQQLATAKQKFLAGEYSSAISMLSSLLYPRPQLSEPSQLAEAHILLGVSYFETGNLSGAETEFEEALFLDNNLTVEPPFFSEKASDAFKRKKDQLLENKKRDEEQKRLAAEAARLRAMLKNSLIVEKRNYLLNFAPFGLGQFQNGHRKKGIALFVSQGSMALLSTGLFFYQSITYGLTGTVPRDEVERVNRIQTIQLSGAALFAVLYIYGVADSLYFYKPKVTREADPDFLRQLRDLEKELEDDKTSVLDPEPERDYSRIVIAPTLLPNSIGLSLGMEF